VREISRRHGLGGIVVEVAAADHLAAVEASRDAALDVLADLVLDRGDCTDTSSCSCSTARALRMLVDAGRLGPNELREVRTIVEDRVS